MEAEVKANIEYDKENKITFLKMEKEIVGFLKMEKRDCRIWNNFS